MAASRKPQWQRGKNHYHVVDLTKQGYTVKEIGEVLGISHQRIYQILKDAGVPTTTPTTRELWQQGVIPVPNPPKSDVEGLKRHLVTERRNPRYGKKFELPYPEEEEGGEREE